MTKYIDAEKLKAEIERLHNEYLLKDNCSYGVSDICEKIEDFITSLHQEQPSLPSNLDEAAINRMHDSDMYLSDATIEEIGDALLKMAHFGAEWMAKQMMNPKTETE